MDDELEIHAEWVQLRLERVILQRRISELEAEIQMYKQRFADLLLSESRQRRQMRQETRDRWAFYHEHKDSLGGDLRWYECKRITDRQFREHKKSRALVDVHPTRTPAPVEQLVPDATCPGSSGCIQLEFS